MIATVKHVNNSDNNVEYQPARDLRSIDENFGISNNENNNDINNIVCRDLNSNQLTLQY